MVASFSFKNQNEENAFGAATAIFSPKNKITCKYKHADYLYTYVYQHWKSTTKESNADHSDIHCFVRLSNFLSQLCTFSYLYLLEKKCTRRKNCCLVLCSLSKTIFLWRSVKEIEGSPCFSHQATTVQLLSFQCQNLCQMQRWDVSSPFRNKLRKDFRISLDTTSPGKILTAKERTWPLVLRVIDRSDRNPPISSH